MKEVKRPFLAKYCAPLLLALCMCLLAACSQQGGTSIGNGGQATVPASNNGKTTVPTDNKGTTQVPGGNGGDAAPGEPFRIIRFVDHTHGWALTRDKVMRSLDGGKTWGDVTAHGEGGGSMMAGGQDAQAVFQTADRAWVFFFEGTGVHVWRTTDGGRHWTPSTFEDKDAIAIADRPHFVGPDNGWIMLSTSAGAGSSGVHLYQTKDGGDSWSQVAAAPGTMPLSGEKYGPSFANGQDGWVANYVGAMFDAPLLDHSLDGGANWVEKKLPLVSSLSDASYRTTPPVLFGSTIIVPVHVSTGTEHHLVMYASIDGGSTWDSGAADFDTENVYVMNQGHAVALDKEGNVYATNQSIQNWSKVGSLPPTADAMSFVSVQEGWSFDAQSPVLYHTTDGGVSWETINYSFVPAS